MLAIDPIFDIKLLIKKIKYFIILAQNINFF